MAKANNPDPGRIKRITESIIGLPTLPTVVSKMIELVDNPKTSAASLARLISTDQALTARILKLANSAYYGFPREISTVNMAIVVIGFNTVKDMGLSLSVFDVFKNLENTPLFDISRFWEHSIACGVASRMLARNYRSRFAGEAFVAGLLHDIGKVILNQYFHTEFIQIMNRTSSGMTLDEAEKEVIGTSHSRIGAWLAEKWNLPRIISDTILNHHTPWESKQDPVFVAIVSIANYLCHISGMGHSGRATASIPDSRIWEIFQRENIPVDEPDIGTLQSEFLVEFDKSETFVSFIHDNEQK
ncbi:MAG: HDOD domain-containing protein [Fibrobacter sp.]|nr:HDOD domain-containing protein [Fibrobacter sp.]